MANDQNAKTEQPRSIELGEERYEVEEATIEQTYLGYENHGWLIAQLSFAGSGWMQAEPTRARTPEDLQGYLTELLELFSVSSWEELRGQRVLVFRKSYLGSIEGIAHPTAEDRVLFFQS